MASRKQIEAAWEKGRPIRGKDREAWRKDARGNTIRHGSYGQHGQYGWDLDHKKPKAKGGTDDPRNIQPLHWEENLKKGDKYPRKGR